MDTTITPFSYRKVFGEVNGDLGGPSRSSDGTGFADSILRVVMRSR